MNKLQKYLTMFTPLVLGFIAMGFAITDLKHPVLTEDQCQLVGRGLSVQAFKISARTLIQQSNQPENDIGFSCRKQGNVVVNEFVPFPLDPNASIKLTVKTFHYFPQRYYFELPLFKHPDGEKNKSA
jgi:hypothetical protein